MLQEILQDIRKEREEILVRAQGAKIFLELSDPKRLERASEIIRQNRVLLERDTSDEVTGTCSPSGGGDPYKVSFRVKSGRVRGSACTCQDSGNVSCKHVLALCAFWLLNQKKIWSKLGEALVLLDPPNADSKVA